MTRRTIGLVEGADPSGAGQDLRKYSSSNPVVRWLLGRWLSRIREMISGTEGVVVDVGMGEGLSTAAVVPPGASVVGVDFRRDKLALATELMAPLGVVQGDAGLVPLRDRVAPLVLCLEVLEHLTDPLPAVAEFARLTSDRCVVSVPWEPCFRLGNLARGKNLSRLGNDPEHVQQFTPARLQRLLQVEFFDVEVHHCFPWLVADARVGRRGLSARRE